MVRLFYNPKTIGCLTNSFNCWSRVSHHSVRPIVVINPPLSGELSVNPTFGGDDFSTLIFNVGTDVGDRRGAFPGVA